MGRNVWSLRRRQGCRHGGEVSTSSLAPTSIIFLKKIKITKWWIKRTSTYMYNQDTRSSNYMTNTPCWKKRHKAHTKWNGEKGRNGKCKKAPKRQRRRKMRRIKRKRKIIIIRRRKKKKKKRNVVGWCKLIIPCFRKDDWFGGEGKERGWEGAQRGLVFWNVALKFVHMGTRLSI